MDHSTPTDSTVDRAALRVLDAQGAAQLDRLEENCARHGVPLYPLGDERQGIVHVIGPELGLTQPGMTIVCGDSHTATHGAFGALAFGIGTSEVGARAGDAVPAAAAGRRPSRCGVDGQLQAGRHRQGHDPRGDRRDRHRRRHRARLRVPRLGDPRALDMEGRMTICNMSIEGGARAGMVAPDETTFE